MSHTLAQLIPWLAPPILGALLGYVASRAAAGIILRLAAPAGPVGHGKPSRLMRRASELVTRELLSVDRLREIAGSEEAAKALGRAVSVLTDGILSRPAADLIQSVAAGSVEDLAARAMRKLLASRELIHVVRGAVSSLVGSLGAKPLREVLAAINLESLVVDRLLPRLCEEPARSSVSRSLAANITGQAGWMVSDEVLDEVPRFLSPLVPDAVDRLVQWLRSKETRAYLAAQGRELLPRILEKLNAWQKLFLSAAQYDRRLADQMPDIVNETVLQLEGIARDPAQQQRALALIREIARDWRDGLRVPGAGDVAENATRRKLEDAAARLIGRVLAGGEDPENRRAVYAGLIAALRTDQQTLGGFIRQAAGVSEAELVDAISTAALRWLTRDGTAERIGAAVSPAVRRIEPDSTLRDILHIDAARKEWMDARIVSWLLAGIPVAIPDLVKAVDADSLAARALGAALGQWGSRAGKTLRRWICVFGTLLGCAIGCAELLLRLVPAP